MIKTLLCSIVVTRGFFNLTSPPIESKLFEVDSVATCYRVAAEYWTAGKFTFTVSSEDGTYERFCGPEHKGCPKWP